MINLVQRETEILSGLKDFQEATVERVYHLFTSNYSRVLVADEVGLGKTLVAKGVIAKLARFHKEVLGDDLFKVVYICSNQSIANQNLRKLKIDERVTVDGLSDTRLSMQHLKISLDEFNPDIKNNYIQLIPLTPSTSFEMTAGCGSVSERALIYAIISRYSPLNSHLKELDTMMMDVATKSWNRQKDFYEENVIECNEKSSGNYLKKMLEKIDAFFKQSPLLLSEIEEVCKTIKFEGVLGKRMQGANKVISQLRRIMAEISVDLIKADFVIMDEFQRFPELINADSQSETALLASKFFNSSKKEEIDTNILLLSATPYKPYSTIDEISLTGSDEHYKEFMQVTNFLFQHHHTHRNKFKEVWHDYSTSLSLATTGDFATLLAKKDIAENHLYKGISRTERLLVEDDTPDNSLDREPLVITQDDILSYVKMDNILKEANLNETVPVEYIKSAPFLMSFMEHYKLKQNITEYLKINPNQISITKSPLLWITRNKINHYKELKETNARLTKLKEVSLPKGSERLLWIPPSLPYYELGGPFKNQNTFSKTLVFSAWTMVPRAISTLLSYDAERLTVGELIKTIPKDKRNSTHEYFGERRFPPRRLTFGMKDNQPANMNHLTLLYPSITLAKIFDPVRTLNNKMTINEIKGEIKKEVEQLINQIEYEPKVDSFREDETWYYIAPLLFDLNEGMVSDWFNTEQLIAINQDKKSNETALEKHFETLRDIYQSENLPKLGKQPDDLLDVLVNMVLGSPAVCGLRMLSSPNSDLFPQVVSLAKQIIDRFNTHEATAIVQLEYGEGNKEAHWQSVLNYAVDGNIQAMLDEYAHMLLEEGGLHDAATVDRNNELLRVMTESLALHTSTYNVDTYPAFKNRVTNSVKGDTRKDIRMRINYAAGFYDTRNEDNSLNRKENLRLAFNSPFRPFVLASTSIGQEGLDFHYYSRKIMHWNLPSNPIDIEQRDGRINRYKSHAIRQNLANKYGDIHFSEDVWNEMFDTASERDGSKKTSELVPFWSLPGTQIERIFPLYPLSRDGAKYNRLRKVLEFYRLSLGQPRQEDLIEYLTESNMTKDEIKEIFINLSPYFKNH